MGTTVKSRPSHYEMLGLRPEASADDIARAFAEKMRLAGTRPMIEVTQVCTAYETLRDPGRRRAYDEGLGLGRKPEKPEAAVAAPRWNASPYMMSAAAVPARRQKVAEATPFSPPTDDAVEPQAAPFVARPESRARELLKRLEEQRRPAPEPRPEPEARPEPRPAQPVDTDHYLLRAVEERLGAAEPRAKGPNRTALIVGALFVGVGVIGAWAGTSAGGSTQEKPSEARVTLALPKAQPVPMPNVEAADNDASEDLHPEMQARAAAAVRRTWRSPPAVPTVVPQATQPEPPVATDPAVADAAAPAVTEAKMPLPEAVVARTIGRIGYACGQVASTSAVDGAAGVFRVTCTSGQSYQATPVGGRYRFRRLSGR